MPPRTRRPRSEALEQAAGATLFLERSQPGPQGDVSSAQRIASNQRARPSKEKPARAGTAGRRHAQLLGQTASCLLSPSIQTPSIRWKEHDKGRVLEARFDWFGAVAVLAVCQFASPHALCKAGPSPGHSHHSRKLQLFSDSSPMLSGPTHDSPAGGSA